MDMNVISVAHVACVVNDLLVSVAVSPGFLTVDTLRLCPADLMF